MSMLHGLRRKSRRAVTEKLAGVARKVKSRFAGFLVHYSQVIHKRRWRLRRSGLTLVIGALTNKEKALSGPRIEVLQSRNF